MSKIKIKDEFKGVQIGFNGSGLPLGMRNDVDVLAQIAIDSQDESLLSMFENLPTAAEIQSEAGDRFLEANPVAEQLPISEKKVESTKK
jgi:hypothetical protein